MKKIFYTLFTIALMSITACGDTFYNVYNGLTGPVESVKLKSATSVVEGSSEQLFAIVYPSMTANKNVTWTPFDGTGKVTVDSSGIVTGVKAGTATVTVTTMEGGFTANCLVTVAVKPVAVTGVSLDQNTMTISTGSSSQLTAVFSQEPKPTNQNVTWSSSKTAVADVSSEGVVYGHTVGTAMITAAAIDGGHTASCTVTVVLPGDMTYTVRYYANDGSGSSIIDGTSHKPGVNFNVFGAGTFSRTHYTIGSWNTLANGTGVSYTIGGVYPMESSNIVLYAQWSAKPYAVTYSAVGYTTGNIPVDSTIYYIGNSVTVKTSFSSSAGSLAKINSSGISYRCAGWSDGTTTYLEGASFPVTSNVTLTAVWEAYKLRDVGPAGGLIFYVKTDYTDGWRYIEAAPNDQGTEVKWQIKFAGTGTETFLANTKEFTAIGTGLENTDKIITLLPIGTYPDEVINAAYLCYNLEICSYNNWFLPSIDELMEMRVSLYGNGLGSFDNTHYYWSSTEDKTTSYPYSYASVMTCGNTTASARHKNSFSGYSVRAARRF